MARSRAIPPRTAAAASGAAETELADLCRLHDVGLDLIARIDDVDDLLDRVLEEYERRLADLPSDAFDATAERRGRVAEAKLRSLVMFATQAAAVKEKARAAAEIRARAEALEAANRRLAAALDTAEASRARLDGVLATLDAGILILAPDDTVEIANRAAAVLIGAPDERSLAGRPLPDGLSSAGLAGATEILFDRGGSPRTVLALRRGLPAPGGAVILLTDVTERWREMEERHRIERLREALWTLGVLSHRINNPLTAMLGRAQILKARRDVDPSVTRAAAVIEEAASRIADLIRELAQVVKEGRRESVDRILDSGPPAPGGSGVA